VKAAEMPPLSDETMKKIEEIYASIIRPLVHHYW